jgi:uncharacterized membrane protein
MDGKQMRKAAREKINAGASAQEAYEALQGGGNIPDEKLADIIRAIPTRKRRWEYRVEHTALMSTLVLSAAMRLVIGPVQRARGPDRLTMALFVMACLACLAGLARNRGRAYTWSLFLMLFTITGSYAKDWDGPEWALGLLWIAMAATILLALHLQKKALSNYITIKEPYTNAEGQARLRRVIRFED